MPQTLFIPRIHICTEPFADYVARLQVKTAAVQSRFVYLHMSWSQVVKYLPPASVDTVVLIDVVEHLEKADSLALIQATIELARRQVLISTPLGCCSQHFEPGETDPWGMGGGAWQEHRSTWLPEDFDERWAVYACREYHTENGKGEKLDPPAGICWAIYDAEPGYVKPWFRRTKTALTAALREFRDRMGFGPPLDSNL